MFNYDHDENVDKQMKCKLKEEYVDKQDFFYIYPSLCMHCMNIQQIQLTIAADQLQSYSGRSNTCMQQIITCI